jgi:hypothetical protein
VDGFLALAALTLQGLNQYGVVPALVWLLLFFGADTRPVDAGEDLQMTYTSPCIPTVRRTEAGDLSPKKKLWDAGP